MLLAEASNKFSCQKREREREREICRSHIASAIFETSSTTCALARARHVPHHYRSLDVCKQTGKQASKQASLATLTSSSSSSSCVLKINDTLGRSLTLKYVYTLVEYKS